MPEQVVTIHSDGAIETTLNDRVLDTRQFGQRKVRRMTEIFQDDHSQWFYIKWLKGPRAGQAMHRSFNTYEEAVAAEVKEINYLRLRGISFRE